jgi:hypothetical protein
VGLFVVTKVGTDRRTFKIQTSEREVTVSADRVRKCPWPQDLPKGMHFANKPATVESDALERDEENLDELTEYVIDHIESHRRDSMASCFSEYGGSALTRVKILGNPSYIYRSS